MSLPYYLFAKHLGSYFSSLTKPRFETSAAGRRSLAFCYRISSNFPFQTSHAALDILHMNWNPSGWLLGSSLPSMWSSWDTEISLFLSKYYPSGKIYRQSYIISQEQCQFLFAEFVQNFKNILSEVESFKWFQLWIIQEHFFLKNHFFFAMHLRTKVDYSEPCLWLYYCRWASVHCFDYYEQ